MPTRTTRTKRPATLPARTVFLSAVALLVVVVLTFLARDVFLRRQAAIDCGDGPRRTIDIRDFTTDYSAYSYELELKVAADTLKAKATPTQLHQLSEAVQTAREFRKYVVAGYNSCAITKAQYTSFGVRFQALDSLAREINELASMQSLDDAERTRLASLIQQYGDLARSLGTEQVKGRL
jgi:hypothetical protein